MEEKKTLSFGIAGEFVTQITREWFYSGEKSIEKIIEILMDSMTGTDTPEGTDQEICRRHSARTCRSEGEYGSRYISSRNIRTGRRRADAAEHEHLERSRKTEESREGPAEDD